MNFSKLTTWSLMAALAACALPGLTHRVRASEIDETKAVKVKAAYLHNFARFIEWPVLTFERDDAPFVIGVLDDEPFADVLAHTVEGKRVAGRRVEVRRFRWKKTADRTRLSDCHALYIGESRQSSLRDILASLGHEPVLIVSDIDGFAGKGGMIGLVLKEGRIVFEINVDALERAGLKASSKLLKLAKIVKRNTDRRETRRSTRAP